MASILDVVRGLSQVASSAYDGYEHLDTKIGLKREKGNPIVDSRLVDGFAVRFAGDKMILTYQSDIQLKELHPRAQFENEISRTLADVVKFLKKEYKKLTKESVSLSAVGEPDILVQSTSRIRSWVQATQQYKIGGLDSVEPTGKSSDEKLSDNIKLFMKTTSGKATGPKNDTRKKQGYDDREDESLGMRTGKESSKKQSDKARREDSYGKWGTRDKKKK
jgi:hypothetical protein